jgi:hypothetical protein
MGKRISIGFLVRGYDLNEQPRARSAAQMVCDARWPHAQLKKAE